MGLLILFIIGICFGSFLGVLVDRLPKNESFLTSRSHCDFCKHKLTFLDLIPLFSFIFLSGECRYCKHKLSPFYPIIELTTGLLFVLIYLTLVSNQILSPKSLIIDLPFYLFIVSFLITIFFTDLKYGIIPDKIIFPSLLVTFAWLIINYFFGIQVQALQVDQFLIVNHLISSLGTGLFFILVPYLFYLVTKKEAMGGGDIKFAFLMGLLLGFPKVIIALYIAFLTGAAISIILILWQKKSFSKGTIPFGPFLVCGTLISLFWGEIIWQKIASDLLYLSF